MPGTANEDARSSLMNRDRIIAVGLLTARDVALLGPAFTTLWPVEEAPHFPELINAIDEADGKLRQETNRQTKPEQPV